jgi:hypothetical protein
MARLSARLSPNSSAHRALALRRVDPAGFQEAGAARDLFGNFAQRQQLDPGRRQLDPQWHALHQLGVRNPDVQIFLAGVTRAAVRSSIK